MWPFKFSGKNNAKMHLRTNAFNGKRIGERFFLKYFILIDLFIKLLVGESGVKRTTGAR